MFWVLCQKGRTVELALAQCVIGAKIRPQKHQRKSEKKIWDPLKGLEDSNLNFFMFSNLRYRVPLQCFSSLRYTIIYWRFIAGTIKVLQNYVTYLFTCVDIWLKPHNLPPSKIKAASLLISNTIIDFQRISLHRLPVAKSSSSAKSGKCILFSYSLHSAVKKKKTSLNSPGCLILHLGLTSGGRIFLFTLPYFFSRFLSKPCSWGARWS